MSTSNTFKSLQEWQEKYFPEAQNKIREQRCFENPEAFAEKLVNKLAISMKEKKSDINKHKTSTTQH
jgi:hypothetical protein